jgi:O-antigen ligase
MYLEVVFALGLWWIIEPPDRSRSLAVRLAPSLALLLVAAGIIATFTRTGLIVIATSLAGVAALRFLTHRNFDHIQRSLAGLAVVIAGFVALSRTPEAWVGRLTADTAEDWYGARFEAPRQLSVRSGAMYDIPITVTNDGRITWQSDREPVFALSYHWLSPDTGEVIDYEGARTPFAQPVAPGQQVTMAAKVRAPRRAGEYQLTWDIVHEGRTWLSAQGVQLATSRVSVEGARDLDALPASHSRLPVAALRLPRRTLWRAAVHMAWAHPFAGVGPDNFRLVYGDYLGLETWDERVHANNMYLEALAGTGLCGLAALLWLIVSAGRHLWAGWRASTADTAAPWACLLVAWLGIAGHGLVDSFLSFTTTYVVFALAAGLAVSPALDATAASHAHRL